MSRRRHPKSNLNPLTLSDTTVAHRAGKVVAHRTGKIVTSEVRIIGGRFKRQKVAFIGVEGLRPTPDRLRETVFNWVQFDLHDAQVLDVCAGSGVLGFEALSRGARYATFIESHPKQAELLKQTAHQLQLASIQFAIYNGDALGILPQLSTPANVYHLVFIDPPYDLQLWVPLLMSLVANRLINTVSLLYIEDKRPLSATLSDFDLAYTVLKQVHIGQIYASLIQVAVDSVEH